MVDGPLQTDNRIQYVTPISNQTKYGVVVSYDENTKEFIIVDNCSLQPVRATEVYEIHADPSERFDKNNNLWADGKYAILLQHVEAMSEIILQMEHSDTKGELLKMLLALVLELSK